MNLTLSIIIVSYNSAQYLDTCISSIFAHKINYSHEIIVVDNHSTDPSVQIIKSYVPPVMIIENMDNYGFSGGINVGIRASRGDLLLILNPDTIMHENAINNLIEFAQSDETIGIIGPKLLNPDGSLQESCRIFHSIRTILFRRTFLGKMFPNSKIIRNHMMLDWDHGTPKIVDWVLGACFLVRKKIITEHIGYFDEKYKLYFEDADICYRMKKGGYKVYYYPFSTCIHNHRRESAININKKTLWHIMSGIHFFNRHGWR